MTEIGKLIEKLEIGFYWNLFLLEFIDLGHFLLNKFFLLKEILIFCYQGLLRV